MIISDIDYLFFIPETDVMSLNGGEAVATSTGLAIATGSSTATNILSQILAISKLGYSRATSSTTSSAKSSDGSTFSFASSSAAAVA